MGESIIGSHGKNNALVTFLDAAGEDFLLSPLETVARDAGQVLLNDPSVNDGRDNAGELRDDRWDIGAFEWTPNRGSAQSVWARIRMN